MKQILLIPKIKFKKRKVVRAISLRHFNHVVFKARWPVLRQNHRLIKRVIGQWQIEYGVRLKALAIMEDHIHFAVKTPTRVALQNFMRVVAGMLALKIARGKLWKSRAWSRIVKAGRDLKGVVDYILANPRKARIIASVIDEYVLDANGVLRPG